MNLREAHYTHEKMNSCKLLHFDNAGFRRVVIAFLYEVQAGLCGTFFRKVGWKVLHEIPVRREKTLVNRLRWIFITWSFLCLKPERKDSAPLFLIILIVTKV